MRLFLGIDLPGKIKDYLFDVQADLKDNSLAKVAWDGKKKFHVTLKFLGEIPDDKVEELKNKFRNIKFNKFRLKLSNIGYFPGDTKINVIWVGVIPEEPVTELQKLVDYETLKYGVVRLGSPHITFGRVKFVRHRKGLLEKIRSIKVDKVEFNVESFSLYKSTLTKDGSFYDILETYNLG